MASDRPRFLPWSGGILEHLTQQLVEVQLLVLGPISGSDLDQDNLVGSRNPKTHIQGDHPTGTIF